MLKPSKAAVIAAAAVCLCLSGCGEPAGSVSGTVTLDGQPLNLGVVTFHPVAGGPAAIGAVTKNGTYEVSIGGQMSIPTGEYLVTVDAAEPVTVEMTGGGPKPPPAPKRITPDKYANKDTTELRVTVKTGSNKIPLELKSGK